MFSEVFFFLLFNRKDQQSQELGKMKKVMFQEKEITVCFVLKEGIKALKMMLIDVYENLLRYSENFMTIKGRITLIISGIKRLRLEEQEFKDLLEHIVRATSTGHQR